MQRVGAHEMVFRKGADKMTIEIVKMEFFGYTLLVNGEVMMECLSEDEVNGLTIAEIKELI